MTKDLSQSEARRAIEEILTSRGEKGVSEPEIELICKRLQDLVIGSALLNLWRNGKIKISGVDLKKKDISFSKK